MTVFVADIASYQHGLALAALRPDCVAVEIKCTEGAGYQNPDYAGWLAEAKAAQLLPIAYHYVNQDQPSAQAANLAAHIGDRSLPVMLDVEAGSGDLQHVLAVADAMAATDLNVRLLYLPQWYWHQVGSPDLTAPLAARRLALISAHYPSTAAGTLASLYPGDDSPLWSAYGPGQPVPALLQFTDNAREGGQGVDMNAYRGSAAQLAALLGTPQAAPAPASDAPPWPGRTFAYGGPGAAQIHGDDVRRWQARMAWRGWSIAVDGAYGPQSSGVARAFQQDSTAHGWPLADDGIVGLHTWTTAWARPVSR